MIPVYLFDNQKTWKKYKYLRTDCILRYIFIHNLIIAVVPTNVIQYLLHIVLLVWKPYGGYRGSSYFGSFPPNCWYYGGLHYLLLFEKTPSWSFVHREDSSHYEVFLEDCLIWLFFERNPLIFSFCLIWLIIIHSCITCIRSFNR